MSRGNINLGFNDVTPEMMAPSKGFEFLKKSNFGINPYADKIQI